MLKIEQFVFVLFSHDCFKILPDRYTSSVSSGMHALCCLFAALRCLFLGNHIPADIAVAASNAFLFTFRLSKK